MRSRGGRVILLEQRRGWAVERSGLLAVWARVEITRMSRARRRLGVVVDGPRVENAGRFIRMVYEEVGSMGTDNQRVQALLQEGDRYYQAGNYKYASVSYDEAKKLVPSDPEVLARWGLALWRKVPGYFAELMAETGVSEPGDGYVSLLSDAASEAAGARCEELEKVTGTPAKYAATSERLALLKYRNAVADAKGQATLAAKDLLVGRSSSLSAEVEQALSEMEHKFPGIAQHAQEWSRGRKEQEPEKKGGGCFVATAVYRSPMAGEVQALRDYRDFVLVRTAWGRVLVGVYERIGPHLARILDRRPLARALVRELLLRPVLAVVRRCRQ